MNAIYTPIQENATIPIRRADRHATMIGFLSDHFGRFYLDESTFAHLEKYGFCRARAEQTIEELLAAKQIVLRGSMIETPEVAALRNWSRGEAV